SIVSFNALPTVTLSSQGTTCVNYAPIVLTGGTPAGGVYSGPAVTSGEFNPAGAGVGTFSITYTFTDGNGCTNSASQNMVVDACLSVEEIGSTISNLYPNPAADYVIIEGSSSIQSITIMDLSGKVISNQVFNALNSRLDLSTVSSGIYFIEVITANGNQAVRKLVVNK
ncbi:MAG: T9SS type A sorting domain-containing protein, partial [Flavobacteriales bacterium]